MQARDAGLGMERAMIVLDGAEGEGGGQILRTALTLSMITGEPFRIERIRAGRARPGLLRQHLTCVRAAEAIARARVSGAHLGSSALSFEPSTVAAGTYEFAIASAGSSALVLQTVLPALLRAGAPSEVTLSGGTHNPAAPTFDYLERVLLPLLARMGASVTVELQQAGFYPAGGGRWRALVQPVDTLQPLVLEDAGPRLGQRVEAIVANLPFDIALREARGVARQMSWPEAAAEARTVESSGHGNVLAIELRFAHMTEMVTAFGTRDRSAESVAQLAVEEARAYLAAGVPVGPHLADQLLVPMALAGGGSFVTMHPTPHTLTNIAVIEKFLPVAFDVAEVDRHRWRVAVAP